MKLKIVDAVVKDISLGRANEAYIKAHLRPDTEISFARLEKGFPSIECDLHAAINKPGIISAAIKAERDGFDGVFINCFDDPGVYECREALSIPVYGGYVPAITMALATAERIAVITTDRAGILSEERKARMLSASERIAAIEPLDMGVLELQNDPEALACRVADKCESLAREHRVSSICLGCTAMYVAIVPLRAKLKERGYRVNVIEPLSNGVAFLEHAVMMGYGNGLGVLSPASLNGVY